MYDSFVYKEAFKMREILKEEGENVMMDSTEIVPLLN